MVLFAKYSPLKTLMGFSVHLNVQLKFYNLPFKNKKSDIGIGSDISILTSNTYVHLSTESKKEIANLFDQVFQNLS